MNKRLIVAGSIIGGLLTLFAIGQIVRKVNINKNVKKLAATLGISKQEAKEQMNGINKMVNEMKRDKASEIEIGAAMAKHLGDVYFKHLDENAAS
jgi:uncharacterized membrane-anchored protein YhcB (DUF1043 family)